jgi:hypothetical protein
MFLMIGNLLVSPRRCVKVDPVRGAQFWLNLIPADGDTNAAAMMFNRAQLGAMTKARCRTARRQPAALKAAARYLNLGEPKPPSVRGWLLADDYYFGGRDFQAH